MYYPFEIRLMTYTITLLILSLLSALFLGLLVFFLRDHILFWMRYHQLLSYWRLKFPDFKPMWNPREYENHVIDLLNHHSFVMRKTLRGRSCENLEEISNHLYGFQSHDRRWRPIKGSYLIGRDEIRFDFNVKNCVYKAAVIQCLHIDRFKPFYTYTLVMAFEK